MVKRYELQEGDCVEDTGLVEDDFGYWVEYPDYAALEARVAVLEEDAARYLWLRDLPVGHDDGWIANLTGDHLDSAIDEAMSREA